MKFCVDCKHYNCTFGVEECRHPRNIRVNLITGEKIVDYNISGMRYSILCGPIEAKLYEERESFFKRLWPFKK